MEETDLDEPIHLKKELYKYLSYWKWFLMSMIIALTAAYFYIKQASIIYKTESKIKVLDEDQGFQLPSDALSLMSSSRINLENEIEVIKSKLIFEKVIRDLNLTTKYFSEGQFKKTELWVVPFKVTSTIDPNEDFETLEFGVIRTDDGFIVKHNDKRKKYYGSYVMIKMGGRNISIEANTRYQKPYEYRSFLVQVASIRDAQEELSSRVSVEAIGKESEVLAIAYEGENILKSKAIVNTIIEKFSEDGVIDRQLVSKKTVEFIDDRFQYLSRELDSIETRKKDYKQSNQLSYLEADAGMGIGQKAQSEQGVFQIETQIALSNLLKNALRGDNPRAVLPANIGVDNEIINALTAEYNSAVLMYDKLSVTAGINNPAMASLRAQIAATKNNINQSINTYLKQLNITLNQQRSNYSRTMGQVSDIPVNEQILRGIDRQQKIKEDLYLLLLQKREESAIAFAVTIPSIKIIDYANSGRNPVSPKIHILYLAAFTIGLLIPFIILYLHFTLDAKIKDAHDPVFVNSKIPIVGELPQYEDFAIFKNRDDRSVQAESFRILSSNIDFSFPKNMADNGQVLLVTSSILGEGKSYIATNLALTYASYNKRVLLIGADLRKPTLNQTLDMMREDQGLSNYLHDLGTNWKSFVTDTNPYNEYLDILFSGNVPPNPSTLFSGDRFSQLIEQARMEYDYIVIDSPPTIYVNDTFLIARSADLTVYITRFNYTDKDLITYSKNLNQNGKLPNMVYILNGIENGTGLNNRYSYNYGYGYGYGDLEESTNRSLWQKFKNIF